jgi:hypothetical protein
LSAGVHKYLYNAPIKKSSIKENIRWKTFDVPSTGDITKSDSISETGIHKNSTSVILTPPVNGIYPYDGTGRQRHIFRTFSWIGVTSADLLDYQWKSMVLGYQKNEDPETPPNGKEIVPYVDFLLGTSSGELRPTKYVYNDNEQMKTGWLYNTGNYLQLDSNNNLTLSFKLSWSSPCGDASGCA